MKVKRRSKLLVESPASATSDIAFILIVFFLVCAAVPNDMGRSQTIPKAEEKQKKEEQSKMVQVQMTRFAITIDGNPVSLEGFKNAIAGILVKRAGSAEAVENMPDGERLVAVSTKGDPSVPFKRWVAITSAINDVGGIITVQIEEERVVQTD
jgi:biopolymer transport protein ExbD